MGAITAAWFVIGSALILIGAIGLVVLCFRALRLGAEFEGEIKALSLASLKFRVNYRDSR